MQGKRAMLVFLLESKMCVSQLELLRLKLGFHFVFGVDSGGMTLF